MAGTSSLVLFLFPHVENHLFQTPVQLAARRETGFHKFAPIRLAPQNFFGAFRRDADVSPAWVIAQSEDVVQ